MNDTARTIDIHTHADQVRDGLYIYNAIPGQAAAALRRHARISIGLHPWCLLDVEPQTVLDEVAERAGDPGVIAIGECGLDRLIEAPLDVQTHWFRQHLEIAERVDKPVIVHCVRAHNELVHTIKTVKLHVPVIIHGYNNNLRIAEQLWRCGILLSFGPSLLRPDAFVRQVLAACSDDGFFLETDDGEVAIESIYAAAAECRGVSRSRLETILSGNYQRCFGSPRKC